MTMCKHKKDVFAEREGKKKEKEKKENSYRKAIVANSVFFIEVSGSLVWFKDVFDQCLFNG